MLARTVFGSKGSVQGRIMAISSSPSPSAVRIFFRLLMEYGDLRAVGGVKIAAAATSGINNNSGTISIATASASQLGGVKIGDNISVSNGTISVKSGTNEQAGVVTTKSTISGNNASLGSTDTATGTVPTVWGVEKALKDKQDKLTAGTGISIEDGTVSVSDTVVYEVVP